MLQNPLTAFVPATTDEWSDLAVATLLDCYIDKHIELNRGSIRAKGWQDVIAKINSVCANGKPIFTYRRCKNKLDVMKRRFKLENDRKFSNGGIPSDWPWFQKMEEIMARNCMYSGIPGGVASGERLTPVLTRFHNGTIGFDDAEGERDSPNMAPGGAVQLTVRKEDCQETDKRFHSALCDKEDNKPNMFVFCDRARNRPENPVRCHEAKNRHNIPNGGAVADQRPSNIPGVSRKGCLPAGVSRNTFRKKRKNSCCSPGRQAREVARLVIEAFEKIELRRIEVMREMEIRRHETHLQIAKMIIDSNVQSNQRCCNHQKESNNTDPKEQKLCSCCSFLSLAQSRFLSWYQSEKISTHLPKFSCAKREISLRRIFSIGISWIKQEIFSLYANGSLDILNSVIIAKFQPLLCANFDIRLK